MHWDARTAACRVDQRAAEMVWCSVAKMVGSRAEMLAVLKAVQSVVKKVG